MVALSGLTFEVSVAWWSSALPRYGPGFVRRQRPRRRARWRRGSEGRKQPPSGCAPERCSPIAIGPAGGEFEVHRSGSAWLVGATTPALGPHSGEGAEANHDRKGEPGEREGGRRGCGFPRLRSPRGSSAAPRSTRHRPRLRRPTGGGPSGSACLLAKGDVNDKRSHSTSRSRHPRSPSTHPSPPSWTPPSPVATCSASSALATGTESSRMRSGAA